MTHTKIMETDTYLIRNYIPRPRDVGTTSLISQGNKEVLQ